MPYIQCTLIREQGTERKGTMSLVLLRRDGRRTTEIMTAASSPQTNVRHPLHPPTLTTFMHSSTRSYFLPDLHSLCPWSAGFNAHHDEVATDSFRWLLGYIQRAPELCAKGQVEVLMRTRGELLAAYSYPHANAERLRTCADFMNLLFFIDEITDRKDGQDAESSTSIFLNAMRNESYDDGSLCCRISKE